MFTGTTACTDKFISPSLFFVFQHRQWARIQGQCQLVHAYWFAGISLHSLHWLLHLSEHCFRHSRWKLHLQHCFAALILWNVLVSPVSSKRTQPMASVGSTSEASYLRQILACDQKNHACHKQHDIEAACIKGYISVSLKHLTHETSLRLRVETFVLTIIH